LRGLKRLLQPKLFSYREAITQERLKGEEVWKAAESTPKAKMVSAQMMGLIPAAKG